MNIWNDPNPHRRLRNRLILIYVALMFGLSLLCGVTYVITDLAGIPNEWVRFLAYPAGFLVPLLPPFAIWMVVLTHRAKKWEKDPRAQGRLSFENARKREAKDARLVEEEYSRETGASWLTEESLVEKEYGRNAGERWVTALAGSVEKPVESRVDLARREDGWVVRETRAERGGPFAHVVRTTSHRLAKGYFANHSEEDFLAQLAQWFPERNFDGARSNPAVRALFAGTEPEPAPEAGVEWIERFYSENNGGILYPVDLVRVGEECFVRDGSFSLEGDGERGVFTCNYLGARYLRERTVEDLIWDVEVDLLLATHRHITSAEKQRLRESPRLRALFAGKRSVSSDVLCRWLRVRGANEQDLPSVDLLERASGWTFVESLTQDDARRLDLPADCLSPEALPRTLASVAETFPEFDEAQSRAALAAALSAIGEADGRVAELYSRNSESGSDVVVESLDLHRDSSGRFFLRHRWMTTLRLIPSERIEILPLPEDYFRAHSMEEFIKTARHHCFKEIDAAALRRNPALQALFENPQANPAPQPEP